MFASCRPKLVPQALLATPPTVHVAPTGHDRAAGTASQPFAAPTLARGPMGSDEFNSFSCKGTAALVQSIHESPHSNPVC